MAATTLNLLNINHIAEQPDGTEVAHTGDGPAGCGKTASAGINN
jgi:hypothetical protein